MNLRDLEYIVTLAQTKHFGQAAERCHVSQPTLSGQLRKTEDQLGIMIFERGQRSVKITQTGKRIIKHAQNIMEQVAMIKLIAQANQDPMTGVLRIGTIPTISPYLMPLVLRPLRERYPDLRIVLIEDITQSLTERLINGELEVAILATTEDKEQFEQLDLYDEKFWLACPQHHPLMEKAKITEKDLQRKDLLLLTEGHCLSDQVLKACKMQRRQVSTELADLRAASLDTLMNLVEVGFGCTLVPALVTQTMNLTHSSLALRKLDVPNAKRRISLVFRRSFPRRDTLRQLAETIVTQLPNDLVTPLFAAPLPTAKTA